MITCPSCNQENMSGAAFCSECGATLLNSNMLTTQKIHADHPAAAMPSRSPTPAQAGAPSDNWITLHLLDNGEMLPLADRNEFTLGRVSQGQAVVPDIDLGPYQAFTHGVSRLHAVIRRGVDNVLLSDLESANGTFINGQRLPANQERSLAHGDVISLGGMKMQILLRNP